MDFHTDRNFDTRGNTKRNVTVGRVHCVNYYLLIDRNNNSNIFIDDVFYMKNAI